MEVFRIRGGTALRGEVAVSGSKNAALPQLAATLLSEETSVLENVPDLSDVRFMAEILRHLGAEVTREDATTWKVSPAAIGHQAPYELVRKMRASVCLLGPLVGRLRKAVIPLPGGCVIGQRPIDLHLKALEKLGARATIEKGDAHVDGSALRGGHLFLGGRHGSTVTGTANAIMAAVLAPGSTRMESAACEPEITDLCRMLCAMGAKIEGMGSHELTIEGVDASTVETFKTVASAAAATMPPSPPPPKPSKSPPPPPPPPSLIKDEDDDDHAPARRGFGIG